MLDDLSGYEIFEDDWLTPDEIPVTLVSILDEVGRIYIPYLLANAQAVANKQDVLRMELDGKPWQQHPFSYQARCLQWIRDEHLQLTQLQKEELALLIKTTGIDEILI